MPSISQDTSCVRINFSKMPRQDSEEGVPFEREVFHEQSWASQETTMLTDRGRLGDEEVYRQIGRMVSRDVATTVRHEFDTLRKEMTSLIHSLSELLREDSKGSSVLRQSVKLPLQETRSDASSSNNHSPNSRETKSISFSRRSASSLSAVDEHCGKSVFKDFKGDTLDFPTLAEMRKMSARTILRSNGSTGNIGWPSETSSQPFGREWLNSSKEEDPLGLRSAVQENNYEKLTELLEKKADPNTVFPVVDCKSKKFLDCSVVALAAINEDIDIVQMLVNHRADINAGYGFLAGALQMRWSGPAVFAPVPRGNLGMLKEMVEMRADPTIKASNDSNLVWQSCYFGHEEILRYLLEYNVDLNSPAQSQDQKGISYTPVHIATLHGRDTIVEELLCWKADPNRCAGSRDKIISPLSDAIRHCQPNIVRSLVAFGAKIDDTQTQQTYSLSRSDSIPMSETDIRYGNSLNLLFRDGFSNPVIVHAVALGLQKQEQQVKNLTIEDVCKFLAMPGKSQSAIMDAIFKKRIIKYRSKENTPEQVRTCLIKRAQILPGGYRAAHLNIATTPHTHETMETWFKNRKQWDPQDKIFLNKLAPWRNKSGDNYHQDHDMLSILTYESLVANIQNDLRVIRALTSSVDQEVFGIRSCQAIVQSSWEANHIYQLCDVTIQAALLIWYLLLTLCAITLESDTSELWRWISASGLPFCCLQVLATMLELYAYWEKRWIRDSFVLLIDIIADSVTAAVFSIFQASILDWFPFRFVFGVSCMMKWVKLLYSLTPYRTFGMPVLPILTTMRDILPFCGVFVFYILGIMHAILVMKVSGKNWHESMYNTIAFVFTAEIPLLELVEFPSLWEELFIHSFVILAAFLVPVTMMNTFIAALGGSYKLSIKNMEKLYQDRCAKIILRLLAVRSTLAHVRLGRFKLKEDDERRYLWYSLEAPDEGSSVEEGSQKVPRKTEFLTRKSNYTIV